jgi:MoaA/NifB/PqqE/SkfB family radical SAM enzyme
MQTPKLKLREIIWEITGRCENGCSYCGSKEVWNEEINEENIVKIAKKIAEYPPEEIDISGGDPLLVSFITHEKVVGILKEAGIKVKILFNPKSYAKCDKSIFLLYDWIGISVNTEEELNIVKDIPLNFTIITNFNTQNLYLYDNIEDFVKSRGAIWQVQFTMTNKKDLAIYENNLAQDNLFNKMHSSIRKGVRIIAADNMNDSPCGAGTSSIGILYNGNVVPCLSMRSWTKVEDNVQGNLLDDKQSLINIWINGFKKYRYDSFECCKDQCRGVVFIPNLIRRIIKTPSNTEPFMQPVYAVKRPQDPIVMMYGVSPDTTIVYGVTDTPSTMLYAVFDSNEYNPSDYSYHLKCECTKPERDGTSNICKNCGGKIEE